MTTLCLLTNMNMPLLSRCVSASVPLSPFSSILLLPSTLPLWLTLQLATAPIYSFLVENKRERKKVLFDLGILKSWEEKPSDAD
jgi:hypothetical protein